MINPKILRAIRESIEAVKKLLQSENTQFIEQAALYLSDCFSKGNKVIIAGNGGSLCDASHFAEELTGIFRQKRKALPAIVLSEPGHLTCVGNDLGFEWVFARGIEAFGKPNDIFIGLTTSGNSPNIIKAFEVAKRQQLKTIAFLGKQGGTAKGMADLEMIIDGFETSDRIQEAHMAAIHIIIEILEDHLFYTNPKKSQIAIEV